MFEKKIFKNLPDRPFECGECKKPIHVRYTEIIDDTLTHTSMCADCPELQKRLYGIKSAEIVAVRTGTIAGLCCGNCGTTLEEVKRGHHLGCEECYSVFGAILINELQESNVVPLLVSNKKHLPLHIGRAPGENLAVNDSLRLLALNEALKDTLFREDYEQAAWLRDQIKALTPPEDNKTEEKVIPNE